MKFPRRKRRDVSIELYPLIDVVLLLLIFFMVTSTTVPEMVLSIVLPPAHGETMPVTASVIEIAITSENEVLIDGENLSSLTYSSIQSHLREKYENYRDAYIVIRGDGAADHGSVVMVLDAIGGLGITNVRILATDP